MLMLSPEKIKHLIIIIIIIITLAGAGIQVREGERAPIRSRRIIRSILDIEVAGPD